MHQSKTKRRQITSIKGWTTSKNPNIQGKDDYIGHPAKPLGLAARNPIPSARVKQRQRSEWIHRRLCLFENELFAGLDVYGELQQLPHSNLPTFPSARGTIFCALILAIASTAALHVLSG